MALFTIKRVVLQPGLPTMGLWSWDNNEILVGFAEGQYNEEVPGLHKINRASEKGMYARSKDGGINWTIGRE